MDGKGGGGGSGGGASFAAWRQQLLEKYEREATAASNDPLTDDGDADGDAYGDGGAGDGENEQPFIDADVRAYMDAQRRLEATADPTADDDGGGDGGDDDAAAEADDSIFARAVRPSLAVDVPPAVGRPFGIASTAAAAASSARMPYDDDDEPEAEPTPAPELAADAGDDPVDIVADDARHAHAFADHKHSAQQPVPQPPSPLRSSDGKAVPTAWRTPTSQRTISLTSESSPTSHRMRDSHAPPAFSSDSIPEQTAHALRGAIGDVTAVYRHVHAVNTHVLQLCREREQLLRWLESIDARAKRYRDAYAAYEQHCGELQRKHQSAVDAHRVAVHQYRTAAMSNPPQASSPAASNDDAAGEEDESAFAIDMSTIKPPVATAAAATRTRTVSGSRPAALPAPAPAPAAAPASDGLTSVGLSLAAILDRAKAIRSAESSTLPKRAVPSPVAAAAPKRAGGGVAASAASQKPVYGNPSSFSGSLRKSSAGTPPPPRPLQPRGASRLKTPLQWSKEKQKAAAEAAAAAAEQTAAAAAAAGSLAATINAASAAITAPPTRKPATRTAARAPALAQPPPPPEPPQPPAMPNPPPAPEPPNFRLPTGYVALYKRYAAAAQMFDHLQQPSGSGGDAAVARARHNFVRATEEYRATSAPSAADGGGSGLSAAAIESIRQHTENCLDSILASAAADASAPDGDDGSSDSLLLHPYAARLDRAGLHAPSLVDAPPELEPAAAAVPAPNPYRGNSRPPPAPVARVPTAAERAAQIRAFEASKLAVVRASVLADVQSSLRRRFESIAPLHPFVLVPSASAASSPQRKHQHATAATADPSAVQRERTAFVDANWSRTELLRVYAALHGLLIGGEAPPAAAGDDDQSSNNAMSLRRFPTFIRK